MKKIRIVVGIEGGIACGASMDAPEGVEVEIAVVDYDTDGLQEDRMYVIPQNSGYESECSIDIIAPVNDSKWVRDVFKIAEED